MSVLAGACALAAGEIPVWLSSAWPSYTTMIGLSLSWTVLLAGLARRALDRWSLDRIGWGAAALVSASTIAASYSVATSFSIPLWVQQQRVMEYAADKLRTSNTTGLDTKAFCIISDIGPGSDPLYGVAEFTWTNAQPFYSYWNVRTLLRLMGRDDGLITETLASPSGIVLSQVGDDDSAAQACEGEEFLDLSNPSKFDLSSIPVFGQQPIGQRH